MSRVLALALLSALLVGGCSDDKSTPTTPTPPINVGGTWIGDVSVSGTTTRMTWTLSQSGTAVTGPVLLSLPSGTVLLNGFLTGTLTGNNLAYTISVGPGNIPTQPTCAGQVAGTMTATIGVTATLSGTSAVTGSTCTPPFPGGALTLTRS